MIISSCLLPVLFSSYCLSIAVVKASVKVSSHELHSRAIILPRVSPPSSPRAKSPPRPAAQSSASTQLSKSSTTVEGSVSTQKATRTSTVSPAVSSSKESSGKSRKRFRSPDIPQDPIKSACKADEASSKANQLLKETQQAVRNKPLWNPEPGGSIFDKEARFQALRSEASSQVASMSKALGKQYAISSHHSLNAGRATEHQALAENAEIARVTGKAWSKDAKKKALLSQGLRSQGRSSDLWNKRNDLNNLGRWQRQLASEREIRQETTASYVRQQSKAQAWTQLAKTLNHQAGNVGRPLIELPDANLEQSEQAPRNSAPSTPSSRSSEQNPASP